jgi:hypothetical protein
MARDLVIDGKGPNLFFVSASNGKVTAVISTKGAAVDFAEATNAYLVEDRKHGEVWGSPAYLRAQRI